MEPNKKPVLSIGMIFKNEIRCLERCMKALQPLRDAIPCELVMADTGSDDGSREIAEQYADILFDFPWINDFAAARNAVMDRCSGQWYFSIDCDEWLDQNLSELEAFLTGEGGKQYTAAGITIRNYTVKELDRYSDMLGIRLVRLDTGARYVGAIHEALKFKDGQEVFNTKALLHHDGYVVEGGPGGRAKQDRNMALLEEQLEKDPGNLRLLVECVESGRDLAERARYLKKGVEGVREKRNGWQFFGPSILRYYVLDASEKELPELEARAEYAMELFPSSPFITIDVSYIMLRALTEQGEHTKAVPWGEQYLRNLPSYRSGEKEMAHALLFGTLMMSSTTNEYEVHILLSDAYFHEKQYEKAKKLILELNAAELNEEPMHHARFHQIPLRCLQ